jgi:hypothetical protein
MHGHMNVKCVRYFAVNKLPEDGTLVPKSSQIKLSFPSCVLRMPPTPSFAISSPLIFRNTSLCNFQLLFGPNLPFTGLNFVFSSTYRNPKENACKNSTQQTCMYTLPARQPEDLESVRSRSEVQTLSHAIIRSGECLDVPLFPVPENNYTVFMRTYNTSKLPSGRIAPSGKHHFPHNHRTREKAFKIPLP